MSNLAYLPRKGNSGLRSEREFFIRHTCEAIELVDQGDYAGAADRFDRLARYCKAEVRPVKKKWKVNWLVVGFLLGWCALWFFAGTVY